MPAALYKQLRERNHPETSMALHVSSCYIDLEPHYSGYISSNMVYANFVQTSPKHNIQYWGKDKETVLRIQNMFE